MQGTSLTKQERECKLYDEFNKFAYKKGESLREFYLRFSLLLNDMNIYNMKLEQFQVNTKFLNILPPKWSKFVTDVKLVRDLHTTNIDQLHANLGKHEFHANEVRLMHERNSDPLALSPQYGSPYQSQQYLTHQSSTPLLITYPSNDYQSSIHHKHLILPSSFYTLNWNYLILCDDPIDAINHMMSFLTAVVTSRYPTTNNQPRNSSNPRQQATINNGRVTNYDQLGRQTSVVVVLKDLYSWEQVERILENKRIAQQLEPMLYVGDIIQKTNPIVIPDSKETLTLAEESCLKMLLKHKDNMMQEKIKQIDTTPIDYVALNKLYKKFEAQFVPQTELSPEQAFWLHNSVSSSKPDLFDRPTNVDVPRTTSKMLSMVNNEFEENLIPILLTLMWLSRQNHALAIIEGTWGFKHTKACFRDEIIPFVKDLNDLFRNTVLVITTLKDELRTHKGKDLLIMKFTLHHRAKPLLLVLADHCPQAIQRS
ncbi:hypothetical protein Tco_0898616 [Tanacetum coccineum]